MTAKISLVEMHAVLDDIEIRETNALRAAKERWPTEPQLKLERRVAVLKATLRTLAILATYEDRSRTFVNGLAEEHRRG